MKTIIQKVKVRAPVHTVYQQWAHVERFPEFMPHVASVQRLNDGHLRWRAVVGGKSLEWESEILDQVPDQRITWRTTGARRHAGTVEFRALSDSATEIIVVMAHEPRGWLERAGHVIGTARRQLLLDLERFKRWAEADWNRMVDVAD
jgi:uncharacterized membrane protein